MLGCSRRGQDLPLIAQPLQHEAGVQPGRDQLDRHFLFVFGVHAARAIDLAHAAHTDERDNFVGAESATDPAIRVQAGSGASDVSPPLARSRTACS